MSGAAAASATDERAMPPGPAFAPPSADLRRLPQLRRKIRRLRWFQDAYAQATGEVAARTGIAVTTDPRRLTQAFLAWSERFSQAIRKGVPDRRDFAFYAAGLALAELIRAAPTTALPGTTAPADPIAAAWPEGLLYTRFCLEILAGVLAQEFGEELVTDRALMDPELWASFRENTSDQPDLAIAFLDRFTGNPPDWTTPAVHTARPAQRAAT